jgi:aryl-alcohol dehydrogenase-like predicted oxidoreductase
MTQHPLGKTGVNVSVLGYGSAEVGYLKTDRDRAAAILNLLLDAGVNLIDTASSYPGSEEIIGQAIASRRDQFVLVSKCGTQVSGTTGDNWSAPLIAQVIERSLKNCKTDHLDVMLLHSCDLETLQRGEALGALVKARQAGKIRFAGYSGDNHAAAYAATLPDIAVLETSINFVDQANIDLALPHAQRNNVGVLVKRPIANAAWKDLATQPGMYQNYAKTYTERFQAMKLDPKDLGFAGPQDWPEIALRFTLAQPGVSSALIGTTNPDNARANLAHAAKGPLPEAAVQKIRAAFRAADPNATWTAQT